MATCTRAVGVGSGGLESAAACYVVEVPEPTAEVPEPTAAVPGLGSEVAGPGATAAVPKPPAEVPELTAATFELDPTISGAAGTKMDSDLGEALIDGLRRHWRETPAGIA